MRTTASAERVSHSNVQGYIARVATVAEGWPSGLRRTLGKRVYGKPYRGFESHSLRQITLRPHPPLSASHQLIAIFQAFLSRAVHCRPPQSALRLWVNRG